MAEEVDNFLEHYGVRGMKWGKRGASGPSPRSEARAAKKTAKNELKAKNMADNEKRRVADDKSIQDSRKALDRGKKSYSAAQDKYRAEKTAAKIERKLGNKEKAAEGKRAAKAAMKDAESILIQNIVKNQSNASRQTSKERADEVLGLIGAATLVSVGLAAGAAIDMASNRR